MFRLHYVIDVGREDGASVSPIDQLGDPRQRLSEGVRVDLELSYRTLARLLLPARDSGGAERKPYALADCSDLPGWLSVTSGARPIAAPALRCSPQVSFLLSQ